MMNKRSSFFSFAAQSLILFAVTILLLMLLAYFVGDEAKEFSPLYQMGSKGLASVTILQFLLTSTVINAIKEFFFSDRVFKRLMALWRAVFMLFSVLVASVIFIIIFHWFPLNFGLAWISFLICFGGSCIFASIIMIIKTKMEGNRYDELLGKYKEQHKGDSNNE